MSFDTHTFRETLGLFVTGVTIITTVDPEGQPIGITANSFNSVSLSPPLVLWSVGQASRSLPAFQVANHFAVHILREDQAALSKVFARSGENKFASVKTSTSADGVPLLDDCAARLECSLYSTHAAGDHVIFVAQVDRLASDRSAMPLVYHGGRYAELSDKPVAGQ